MSDLRAAVIDPVAVNLPIGIAEREAALLGTTDGPDVDAALEDGEGVGMPRFGVAGEEPQAAMTSRTSAPLPNRDNTRTAFLPLRLHDPRRRTLRRNASSLPSPGPEDVPFRVTGCGPLL
ncbi:MAG: hypothetical protein ABSD62_08320 [Candidatus Limnocylindrales bacterium]